jgi:elongation factor G
MRVEIEGPREYYSTMVGTLMSRRGLITGYTDQGEFIRIEAEVPLAEMFGYSNAIRSASQGRAEFSMELSSYLPVPVEVQEALVKAWRLSRRPGG